MQRCPSGARKGKMRVAVIGAGVIGVTCASALKNTFPQLDVHVFADKFSPHTTGDGSAGLWSPYLLGDTPPDKILHWGGVTHRWFEELWRAGLASEIGLSLLPIYRVTSDPKGFPDASWTKLVYGARRLTARQLEKLNADCAADYKYHERQAILDGDGWLFVSYTCEPVRLLPWLTKRFVEAGGRLRERKIRELRELADEGYDVIVNCTGLGAQELVADNTVLPIRGQVARVAAAWTKHGFLEDDEHGNYIIPNFDSVVIGGTHQEGDFDCNPREEDFAFIRAGCARILPSLEDAVVRKQWVGLRPGKPTVRLETETIERSDGGEAMVIHNYGHGGAGVTLCWGCAMDVVDIVLANGLKSNL